MVLEEIALIGHGSTCRVKVKLAVISLYVVNVLSVGTEIRDMTSIEYSPIQSRSLL